MSSPPSPNDLTRHQLDELDALLQRMLSVPAGTPSPGTGPTVPELPPLPSSGSWRSDTAGLPSRSPYVAAEPVPILQSVVSRATTVPTWGPDPLARYSPQMPAPTVEVVPQPMLEYRRFPEPTPQVARPDDSPKLFGPPTAETGMPGATVFEAPRTLRGVDAPDMPVDRGAFQPEPVAQVFSEPPVEMQVASHEATPTVPMLVWPVFAVNWVIETTLSLFGPLRHLLTHLYVKNALGICGLLLLIAAGVWTAHGTGWITITALPYKR